MTAAKEHGAPLDLVASVAAGRRAARPAVLRGRHRHARRRLARDAARRRGRVRRLGHLQVRRTRRRAPGAIVEATTHFNDPERVARASEGLGPADAVARGAQARRGSAARRPRLVTLGRRSSASSPCRAASPRTRRVLRSLGAEVREVRTPADLEGLDGLVLPGGESTTMTLGDRARGPGRAAARLRRGGHADLGTCAGLIMLDRDHLGLMDIVGRAQRLRPPAALLRGGPAVPGVSTGRPVRAVFIRAPWIAERGPGRRGPGRGRRPPGGGAPGQPARRRRSTPSSATTIACTARSSSRSARRATAPARSRGRGAPCSR